MVGFLCRGCMPQCHICQYMSVHVSTFVLSSICFFQALPSAWLPFLIYLFFCFHIQPFHLSLQSSTSTCSCHAFPQYFPPGQKWLVFLSLSWPGWKTLLCNPSCGITWLAHDVFTLRDIKHILHFYYILIFFYVLSSYPSTLPILCCAPKYEETNKHTTNYFQSFIPHLQEICVAFSVICDWVICIVCRKQHGRHTMI